MRALWFKQRYVAPILAGEKTDTIRQRTALRVGDRVPLTVGPRPPFAHAEILAVEHLADVAPARRAEAEALVGPLGDEAVRIVFAITG